MRKISFILSFILLFCFLCFSGYSQGKLAVKGIGTIIPGGEANAATYTLGGEIQLKPQWAAEALFWKLNGPKYGDQNNYTAIQTGLLYYLKDKPNKSNFYLNPFLRYQIHEGSEVIYDYIDNQGFATHTRKIKDYAMGVGIGRKQKIAWRFFVDLNLGGYVALRNTYFIKETCEGEDRDKYGWCDNPAIAKDVSNKIAVWPIPRIHFIFLLLKADNNEN